ncbi:MAG: purine-binding chemotaxis protein CheW [Lachnospiraceae bacterium]|nr:purine-binding chemotaxis protein CheW [Lachnospiraceae bacterium]
MAEVDINKGSNVNIDGTQYIVVKVGSEQYGIDIGIVDNIVKMQRITRVPKSQKYYKGVINLRGDVVPVMSLRSKLDMGEIDYTSATRIIITKFDANAFVGFIVDEVMQIVTINEDELESPSFSKSADTNKYIIGIGKHDDILISILDMNAVVDEGQISQ